MDHGLCRIVCKERCLKLVKTPCYGRSGKFCSMQRQIGLALSRLLGSVSHPFDDKYFCLEKVGKLEL